MKKNERSKSALDIHGIVLLNKPSLLSSNTVLQQIKRLFNAQKAGHMGSLDPLATGMLPICFGEATKFAHYGLNADKSYRVRAEFGAQSNTGDIQGEISERVSVEGLSIEVIESAVVNFLGQGMQVPPMYSALKHRGKKLYELARKGLEVEREARPIRIDEFRLLDFKKPYAEFQVRCSKGTYIRSLIADLGQYLGVGALESDLHRDYTAGFELQPMLSLDELINLGSEARLERILPVDFLLSHLEKWPLSQEDLQALYQGRVLDPRSDMPSAEVRLYDDRDVFQGLAEWDKALQTLKAKRLRRV